MVDGNSEPTERVSECPWSWVADGPCNKGAAAAMASSSKALDRSHMLMESTGDNGEPVVGPKTFPSGVSDPEAARFPGLQRP